MDDTSTPAPEPERAYTPQQVASAKQVSRDTVTIWIRTGQLQAFDSSPLPGKSKPRYKITESALRQFELERAIFKSSKTTRRLKKTNKPPREVREFF